MIHIFELKALVRPVLPTRASTPPPPLFPSPPPLVAHPSLVVLESTEALDLAPPIHVPRMANEASTYGSRSGAMSARQWTSTHRWMRRMQHLHGYSVTIGCAALDGGASAVDSLSLVLTSPTGATSRVWLPILTTEEETEEEEEEGTEDCEETKHNTKAVEPIVSTIADSSILDATRGTSAKKRKNE